MTSPTLFAYVNQAQILEPTSTKQWG